MKKNVMMRVASVMMVLVLMTSSVISGTFAKYVAQGEATDTARVAEWGVVITGKTAETNDMFVKQYDAHDGTYTAGVTVDAEVDVVAPGTDGTFSQFTITGQPEVATRITFDATVELNDKWVAGGAFYCPLEVTVKDTTTDGVAETVIQGLTFTNADDFETAIKNAIKAITEDYGPNYDLSNVKDDISISWKWHFQGSTHVGGTGHEAQTNDKDTELGNLFKSGDAPTITVTATCFASQID